MLGTGVTYVVQRRREKKLALLHSRSIAGLYGYISPASAVGRDNVLGGKARSIANDSTDSLTKTWKYSQSR